VLGFMLGFMTTSNLAQGRGEGVSAGRGKVLRPEVDAREIRDGGYSSDVWSMWSLASGLGVCHIRKA